MKIKTVYKTEDNRVFHTKIEAENHHHEMLVLKKVSDWLKELELTHGAIGFRAEISGFISERRADIFNFLTELAMSCPKK